MKSLLKPSTIALATIGGGIGLFLYKFLTMENVSNGEGGAIAFGQLSPEEYAARTAKKEKKERYVQPKGDVAPILILYGTEYGLSAELAQKLESEISEISGMWARAVDMEEFEMLELEKEQLILIITSTFGDGVPPTTARPFFDYLEANASQLRLSQAKFAVLALGDRSYPYYCQAGKTMDRLFEEVGAARIKDRVDVDQEDWPVFDRWFKSIIDMLPSLGLECRPSDYLYERAKTFAANAGKHNKKVPFSAKLVAKQLLTNPNNRDKEGYHFEFELADSELKWIPGDSLAVLAHNQASEVAAVVAQLKLQASLKVATPGWHYQEKFGASNASTITLEHILTKCYDLHNVKPELLVLLRDHAKSADEKAKLAALVADGTSKSNAALHTFLEQNHLVDVLKMFSSARPPINDVLSNLSKLLPRYYSIASSQAHNDKTVSLCVAIVRYQLNGSERIGVASTHMSDRLKIGDQCSIFVNNNPDFRLPSDPSTPIIMIGPGTGIAPFVAFIQERVKIGATGENHLYFGSRSSKIDYLYKDVLESYANDNIIKLNTAFSRETDKKVYVQDRLLENSQQVCDLIQSGGHIYVCGDAKHMAVDVHQTLQKILVQHLSIDQAEAEQFLHQLEKQKRYQKDTWF
ncbi:NADPH-cytochrome-P450 oxidoreductase [Cavenderia fasciculata]|uniref:NADPH-cytochrome-P450 oxidoreductase n=1 Tax=Cavenderia fasciculata TaxID=261658 RepID=F4PJR0_CACFS|nr:NADPH-cytochrome-P450 oxidoreductase [Cavenderia fasciculata]EGG23834.1 NADPH-cytochrome-P450 oxidoreductase [Cavenderia fasciculata]|eukprot:XP_004361685.1 NADPH-cytochrome-P450 oxidoreductase [Cavenderia fasciculata]